MASVQNAPLAQTLTSHGQSSSTWYLPQTVSHRGYNALYPENSMMAFEAAAKAGTHGVETDLHLSRDGVVVLSHDGTLKRCFGREERLADCDWDFLSTLRTTREPPTGMARLVDLLEFLARPGLEGIWVVFDIKADDDAAELVSAIAKTLRQVQSPVPWEQRIVLACWNGNFLHHCEAILPEFSLALTSLSPHHARKSHFRRYEHLGFNMLQLSLVGPCASRFLKWARDFDRLVISWTVNDERWMEWCIHKNLRLGGHNKQIGSSSGGGSQDTLVASGEQVASAKTIVGRRVIDAVITDDPKKFLDVCERLKREVDAASATGKLPAAPKLSTRMLARIVLVHILIAVVLTFRGVLGKRFRSLGDNGPVVGKAKHMNG